MSNQFKKWEDVLKAIESHGHTDDWYIVHVGNDRTKFMTQTQTILYIKSMLGK